MAKFNSPIRGVLLDIDGTLYKQCPLRVRMALELFKYTILQPFQGVKTAYILKGFRANRESLRLAATFQGSLKEFQYSSFAAQVRVPVELVKEIVEEWIMVRPLRFLGLYRRPGIEKFLKVCRDNRIKVGALSDYPTRKKVEALGLMHWFDLHLCSTDPQINKFKPSPEGILLACKTWQLNPEELLYIGDQANIDGVSATAAGARFVLIGQPEKRNYLAVRDFFELAGYL